MSATDLYYTMPLSILRSGAGELEALSSGLSCGIVNAGIGYRKTHGEEPFRILLAEARAHAVTHGGPIECPKDVPAELWEAALAGVKMLNIPGCVSATDTRIYQLCHPAGAVFFRLRSDWMWNAVLSARRSAGMAPQVEFKQLSWREFRILAAILSAKVNTYGFSFLGWETIQARACGFHSKALFRAGAASLLAHCQPLSRRILRQELEKLEALGFFIRCRYSTGERGGFMAYSFRHSKREDLVKAIKSWRDANHAFKTKITANRAADLAAFLHLSATR